MDVFLRSLFSNIFPLFRCFS